MSKPRPCGAPRLHPFDVVFPGTELTVRDGLAAVLERLAPLGLADEDTGNVELVLAEALNNVVEHALASNATQTDIHVRCRLEPDGLHLSVIDYGKAMPQGTAPAGKAPDVDVALSDLPEGGFGWYMIHTLAQEVRYARVAGTNQLDLRIAIGR